MDGTKPGDGSEAANDGDAAGTAKATAAGARSNGDDAFASAAAFPLARLKEVGQRRRQRPQLREEGGPGGHRGGRGEEVGPPADRGERERVVEDVPGDDGRDSANCFFEEDFFLSFFFREVFF